MTVPRPMDVWMLCRTPVASASGRGYGVEGINGTRFVAELEADSEGLVREYAGFFRRGG